jgi:hypothetical protein
MQFEHSSTKEQQQIGLCSPSSRSSSIHTLTRQLQASHCALSNPTPARRRHWSCDPSSRSCAGLSQAGSHPKGLQCLQFLHVPVLASEEAEVALQVPQSPGMVEVEEARWASRSWEQAVEAAVRMERHCQAWAGPGAAASSQQLQRWVSVPEQASPACCPLPTTAVVAPSYQTESMPNAWPTRQQGDRLHCRWNPPCQTQLQTTHPLQVDGVTERQ